MKNWIAQDEDRSVWPVGQMESTNDTLQSNDLDRVLQMDNAAPAYAATFQSNDRTIFDEVIQSAPKEPVIDDIGP